MNKIKTVRHWLESQQATLDQIIAETADAYLQKNLERYENLKFDITTCNAEKYNLSHSKDLCYDRPSVGFVYSLWYHGRRVNTCLKYLLPALVNFQFPSLNLLDMGAGTGAIQWAIGLIYTAMVELNLPTPKDLQIINLDSSPFMLDYNQYLWKNFVKFYTPCQQIQTNYELNSWHNVQTLHSQNTWISASYLFDSQENIQNLSSEFIELVQQTNANVVLLLTSKKKQEYLENTSQAIQNLGYVQLNSTWNGDFFSGDLELTNQRREIYQMIHQIELTGKASWQEFFTGSILIQSSLETEKTASLNEISLYRPAIPQRKFVKLTPQQQEAAKHQAIPTIITGPAGSGKSLVLTERIKNLIEAEHYSSNLKILVTTFNKKLIEQLEKNLKDILNTQQIQQHPPSDKSFIFLSPNSSHHSHHSPNLQLLHFDILPTRIGKVQKQEVSLLMQDQTVKIWEEIIQQVRHQQNLTDSRYDRFLNPDFLAEEFQRVYYGLGYQTPADYLTKTRQGRGLKPRLTKKDREPVWQCLMTYHHALKNSRINDFVTRRLEFLSHLQKGKIKAKFTHIFVDEFQDCTTSDFQIFYQLLENPNHLVIAGDLSQSINLGRSYHIPREADMKNRQYFNLEGSHRLPYRISQAIKPLSEKIVRKHRDGREISPNQIAPWKSAPPGARPIVVYAPTFPEIADKIKSIYSLYAPTYKISKMTILESDSFLHRALRQKGLNVENETIKRIKGLEKECVIWSTRTSISTTQEVEETVYTILTRTSKLLIIALSQKLNEHYQGILGTLDPEKLIFWDKETLEIFPQCCLNSAITEEDFVEDE